MQVALGIMLLTKRQCHNRFSCDFGKGLVFLAFLLNTQQFSDTKSEKAASVPRTARLRRLRIHILFTSGMRKNSYP